MKVRCIAELREDKSKFTVGEIYDREIDEEGHYESIGYWLVTDDHGETWACSRHIFEEIK